MPFTLAHPAAILPLQRFCPRYLSFPALIIGSMVPDLGYASGRLALDSLSHSLVGSFVFALPVGLLALAVFYALRGPAVTLLPEAQQRALWPLCDEPAPPFWVLILSLLIGCWTHLLFDSFTHEDGWLAVRLPLINYPLARFGYRTLRVHAVLGYMFSFAGIVWLALAYARWRESIEIKGSFAPAWCRWRDAILLASLFVPITAVRHIYGGALSLVFVGVASLILVGIAAFWIGVSGANRSG